MTKHQIHLTLDWNSNPARLNVKSLTPYRIIYSNYTRYYIINVGHFLDILLLFRNPGQQ